MPPRRPPSRASAEEPFPGAAILTAESSREVLARLVQGDPLQVRAAARAQQLERALALDSDALALRAMAYMAYDAWDYAGDPPLAPWIEGCVERAAAALIDEDAGSERARVHALPWRLRHPHVHVRLAGVPVERYARARGTTPARIETLLARAESWLDLQRKFAPRR